MAGTSDEKSLSTRRPENVPDKLADARAPFQARSMNPEWRGRRNAQLPALNTGLVDALWRISESVKVYPVFAWKPETSATSALSSVPRALVSPMLKYCETNGLKLIVRVAMMLR